jgi:hypothetical protein
MSMQAKWLHGTNPFADLQIQFEEVMSQKIIFGTKMGLSLFHTL